MDQSIMGVGARKPEGQHAPRRGKTKAFASRARRAAVLAFLFSATLFVVTGLAGCQPRAPVDVGGPFHMVDQDGHPADQSILNGHWSAVFFGYTYCPDICPATLQSLGQASSKLGDRAKTLQVVFVSVDPARDTPPTLKAYLAAQSLPVRTIGLTGSDAQVATIAKRYHVYYAKAGTGPAYSMDHSAVIYLMDPQGRFVAPLNPTLPAAQMAQEIARDET